MVLALIPSTQHRRRPCHSGLATTVPITPALSTAVSTALAHISPRCLESSTTSTHCLRASFCFRLRRLSLRAWLSLFLQLFLDPALSRNHPSTTPVTVGSAVVSASDITLASSSTDATQWCSQNSPSGGLFPCQSRRPSSPFGRAIIANQGPTQN